MGKPGDAGNVVVGWRAARSLESSRWSRARLGLHGNHMGRGQQAEPQEADENILLPGKGCGG